VASFAPDEGRLAPPPCFFIICTRVYSMKPATDVKYPSSCAKLTLSLCTSMLYLHSGGGQGGCV
jgi:hypothetical protein